MSLLSSSGPRGLLRQFRGAGHLFSAAAAGALLILAVPGSEAAGNQWNCTPGSEGGWVEAKDADDTAAERW